MTKLLDPVPPGEILMEEFMKPMNISINALARRIGVSPARISNIVNAKRAISADTALRLERCFGIEAQFWLNLQTDYDLRISRRSAAPVLEAIQPLPKAA